MGYPTDKEPWTQKLLIGETLNSELHIDADWCQFGPR